MGAVSHRVQFYRKDDAVEPVVRLAEAAVRTGGAVIVIATPHERERIVKRLADRGIAAGALVERGRIAIADAEDVLSRIMVNGLPEWGRFEPLFRAYIERAQAVCEAEGQTDGKPTPIALFGGMIGLLLEQENRDAVLRLEQFGSRMSKTGSVRVICAYPIDAFQNEKDAEMFLNICAEHSAMAQDSRAETGADCEKNSRAMGFFQQSMRTVLAELALQRSEQRFRLFVEAVQDYALFLLDPEGHVSTWNKGAQRIKGYEAYEIIGRHFSIFYPEEDVLVRKPQLELEIAAREGRFEDEGWRVRKDGSKFWANVIITALRDEHGVLYGFGEVTRDFTERMLAQEAQRDARRKLEESEKSLRELSFHQFRVQEEERRRIGVELHDSLGQNLSFLKITLDSMVSRLNGNRQSSIGETLAECAMVTEDAIKEVRTIAYLLYPPMLEEMGLKSAVPWYIDGFAQRSGIRTELSISPNLGRLSRDVETAMFRLLQEALTNVDRHSGSATAKVRLALKDGNLELEVSDQGNGIAAPKPGQAQRDWTRSPGVGLRGMNERMRQLGGKLELMLTPVGTTVRATVPIAAVETIQLTPKAAAAGSR